MRPVTTMGVTYVTVSDSQFFVGTVALLNSLRLTGNEGELVVLDCGLTAVQRDRLRSFCRIEPIPADDRTHRTLYKPYASGLAEGVVVFVDSDVIVTGSLGEVIGDAARGGVCAFRDPTLERRFDEWEEVFRLSAPPRVGQPYVCAAFIVFATARWPELMGRWREACGLVSYSLPRNAYRLWERSFADPIHYLDQDALNAILMSEVPAEALHALDPDLGPTSFEQDPVDVVDATSLRCSLRGKETLLLHYAGGPKPWEARGWSGRIFDAYIRLLPRVLLADDLPLRLAGGDVPIWIRGGPQGRVALSSLRAGADAARWALSRLPAPARRRLLLRIRSRVWRDRFRSQPDRSVR